MREFLIIVPDGGMLFEAAGVADILGQANRLAADSTGAALYQTHMATARTDKIIRGHSGLNLLADHCLFDLPPESERDTIVITGRGVDAEQGGAIADWVRRAAPYAKRVVSVCGGSLLLAETGLLNGRRATTHWRLLDLLQTRFPEVRVESGPIYVQDGALWTSAGVSSGFDLTLALVEQDYGFTLARDVAQDLVMYLRRPGGQSQFSRYLLYQANRPGPIRDLQAWILEHLAEDWSVDAQADHVAMSPRHFTRVFTQEVGMPPARYVEDARLEAARQRLEQGGEGLEQIARAVGFGSGLNLRRVFQRKLGVTPSEYRQRFRARELA